MGHKKKPHLAGGLLIACFGMLMACSRAQAADDVNAALLKACEQSTTAAEKVNACTLIIDLGVKNAYVYAQRGHAYEDEKEYGKAIQDASSAIKIAPWYYDGYTLRAAAYFGQKKYPEAIANYTKVIDEDHRESSRYIALNYLSRANAFRMMNKSSLMAGDLDNAIKSCSDDSIILITSTMFYFSMENYQKTIELSDKLMALKPDIAAPFYTKALAEFASVSPAASVDNLSHAIHVDPTKAGPVILLHLARQRSGNDDAQEFDKNSQAAAPSPWEKSVLAFMHGQISSDDLIKLASDPDTGIQEQQVCEGNFYVAESVMAKDKSDARHRLQYVDKSCYLLNKVHVLAHAELSRM